MKKRKAASILGIAYEDSDDEGEDKEQAQEEEADEESPQEKPTSSASAGSGGVPYDGLLAYGEDGEHTEEEETQPARQGSSKKSKRGSSQVVLSDGIGPIVVDPERRSSRLTPKTVNHITLPGGQGIVPVYSTRYSGEDGDTSLTAMDLIPPPPYKPCSEALQEKITTFLERALQSKVSFNQSLQNRKEFHNPYILEKIARDYQIEQDGTNYPPHLYDPGFIEGEDCYQDLAKEQKIFESRSDKGQLRPPESVGTGLLPLSAISLPPPPPPTGFSGPIQDGTTRTRRNKWDKPTSSSAITTTANTTTATATTTTTTTTVITTTATATTTSTATTTAAPIQPTAPTTINMTNSPAEKRSPAVGAGDRPSFTTAEVAAAIAKAKAIAKLGLARNASTAAPSSSSSSSSSSSLFSLHLPAFRRLVLLVLLVLDYSLAQKQQTTFVPYPSALTDPGAVRLCRQ
eukprot:gb/GEZN01002921.1/.p1 GENE.gb/GEZN01002921.1/~~gb/GEZN01002921.1/.p1  ORF type:complete len:459 (-),score=119.69 gb/GEZN01002921.1/:728-2104(-)